MPFQLCPSLRGKAFPSVFLWNGQFPVIRRFTELVGHFQEEQIGELLQVVAVTYAVVAQGVAEAPYFADDG